MEKWVTLRKKRLTSHVINNKSLKICRKRKIIHPKILPRTLKSSLYVRKTQFLCWLRAFRKPNLWVVQLPFSAFSIPMRASKLQTLATVASFTIGSKIVVASRGGSLVTSAVAVTLGRIITRNCTGLGSLNQIRIRIRACHYHHHLCFLKWEKRTFKRPPKSKFTASTYPINSQICPKKNTWSYCVVKAKYRRS